MALDADGTVTPPQHVAVIMDGNGRWAQARGLPVVAGHRKGAEAVQRSVKLAIREGVRYLTLYAFSSENWRRSASEIGDLTSLLRFYLRHKLDELDQQGVRLRVIGEPERFEGALYEELRRAEQRTSDNTRLTLTLALSYGGRADIARAARHLAKLVAEGVLKADDVDEECFERSLQTGDMPPPDILIRTSGERRLSNFLLWESAYAELVFLDVLWPDFGEKDFLEALSIYAGRQRRFGGRPV
uniref:polyprenyl diphosphate synthase n=1 Tax=Neokomagataea thailandica TaxID=661190 RepID=UPI002265ADBE|nr:polyprenyl diphosphate synthase [Neokomagataea thailandica]